MTILDVFNEMLKEIPSISKGLADLIAEHPFVDKWPNEKKQQAVEILQQLQSKRLVECGTCLDFAYVALSELSLILTPRECGIDAESFGPENILLADKYVENLLADINKCSSKIHFYFAGHYYNSENGKFYINWKF